MVTSLNLVTLGQNIDQADGIAIAADAGFEAVGIWADPIEQQPDPVAYAEHLASMCADRDIAAAELCFVGGWMWTEGADLQAALDQARQRAEIAAAANCPLVIACAAGHTGDIDDAAEDFRRLCDIGADVGVNFALEYIGMAQQIKDIPTGLEIVRLADHPNGQLLIDTFHTFRGGSSVEDFSMPTGDEVGLVHVNDAPEGDITELVDSDRVMPGDGAFPLTDAFSRLQENGYDGALSVEVFSEHWWSQPMPQTAQKALSALKSVMP